MVRFIDTTRKEPEANDVPLQVIGAGLPRAATSSLQAAFEQLGFAPCLHMAEIVIKPHRERLLLEAIRETERERRHKLIRELFRGHPAACDLEVVFFVPDLMDMYPDMKVVLNGRPDPEAWAASASGSFGFIFSPWFRWTGLLWSTDRLWYAINKEVVKWGQEHFGNGNILSAGAYRQYYDYVREEAEKRGRVILEYKAEDGWEPLCKYLGKEKPDTPFPRLNERKVFAIVNTFLIVRGLLSWSALFGSGWAIWKYAPRLIRALIFPVV